MDLKNFEWLVPRRIEECRWAEERIYQGQRLERYDSPRLLPPEGEGGMVLARPLARRGSLYRRLAATPATREGVSDFVAEFGFLGIWDYGGGDFNAKGAVGDEDLASWGVAIDTVAHLVRLWDALNSADPAAVLQDLAGRNDYLGNHFFPNAWPGNIDLEGAYATAREIDAGDAEGWVAAARQDLGLTVGHLITTTSVASFRWSQRHQQFELDHVPCSLFGAIVRQLAEAILEGRTSQVCPVCGHFFEVTLGANRGDRKTCSDRCRIRAYRQRMDRARELHREGRTAEQIANELGSDVETVKGWLQKKGKGEA